MKHDNRKTRLLSSALLLTTTVFILHSARPAFAVDYLASLGHAVVDPGPAGTGSFPLYNTDDGFLFDARANRSYVCQGVPSASASAFAFGLSVIGQGTSPETITARAIGDMNPAITEGVGVNGKSRISFTPTTTDRFRINIAAAKAGGEIVRAVCRETTLCGSFNTNGTRFVFLEFVNRSNKPIDVLGTLTTFDGQQATFDPLTVPAFGRKDIALHALTENLLGSDHRTFGSMRFTHNGTGPSLTVHAVRYASANDQGGGSGSGFVLRGSRRLHRCTVLGR